MAHYYLYDGMHSVRALADSAGTLTDAYSYDAYGNLLDNSGSTINPYLYRGEQFDKDLDAYYLRARYYQPGIGRFLTTDPIEGVPNSPMTLHRYVYGNNAPMNFLDPSGKSSLPEKLQIVGLISRLAAMPIGNCIEIYRTVSSFLARHVYPEAYIFGINEILTIHYPFNLAASWAFEQLFPELAADSSFHPLASRIYGEGRELLLSIGSGEVALFLTRTLGSAFIMPPNPPLGSEIYDGCVFNLWNAKDYHGPFESLSLSFGVDSKGFPAEVSGGMGLFWDAKRGFDGPWGAAISGLLVSTGPTVKIPGVSFSLGFAKSNIQYDMAGDPFPCGRPALVSFIYILSSLKNVMSGGVSGMMWGQIALFHAAWNKKESRYNMDARRDYTKDRPDEYRSGPSYWLIPGL
jgi:RHS repeat-associated protein